MRIGEALSIVLLALSLPVVLASAYLLLLAALSGRVPARPFPPPRLRFQVIVPAHDEEAGIAATVASLLGLDYPAELRRVVVVADNCSDRTAERARQAGATVLVRQDAERRGKGYALDLAFGETLAGGWADAAVVVDADTVVSANLLRAFAARLEAGALAIQASYRVRNPADSWRTRLMAIAFTLFNDLRSAGRERLGLSAGLRGNGMCFATSLLREVPHQAYSIVEDLEYGIHVGLAGHRVAYAGEAFVLGDMVATAEGSASQRRRWDGGRRQVARRYAGTLLRRGLAARDPVLVDLGIELLIPPLATLAALAALGWALSLAAHAGLGGSALPAWSFGASLLMLAAYVARGWQESGTGAAGLLALLRAPLFLAWKVGVSLRNARRAPEAWVRTERTRR